MTRHKPLELGFLQSRPRIRAKRVRAIVAFGDITAFSEWTRRGSNSPEGFRSFMVQLYREFIRFRNGNGYFVKLLGDGFMAVREITPRELKKEVLAFLEHCLTLESAIRKIENKIFPKPGSFRITVVVGHVWKIVASRPGQENSNQTDYLGYTVNLAARLLEIDRREGILCHESVRKILCANCWEEAGLALKRIAGPVRCPRGVDPEDLKGLRAVHPLNDSRMAHAIKSRIMPK
jgi:class 3 adenylate cyclase